MLNSKLALAAVGILLAGTAQAQVAAVASTNLNLRTGPGPTYVVQTVIGAGETVAVEGCLDTSVWCRVSYNGMVGWSSGDYLATRIGDDAAVLYPNRQAVKVGTVVYENTASDAEITGATAGVIAGALIAAPASALAVAATAIAGGIIGAEVGEEIDPGIEATAFIRANPVQPVYLDGEVVIGAQVPVGVEVWPVPGSAGYAYLNVNGDTVIIEPENRAIVAVVR